MPVPQPGKTDRHVLLELWFPMLVVLTKCLVVALSIEPDGPPARIPALLVLVAVVDELAGGHDPHIVHSLGVEDEPIVWAFDRVIDGGEECCVTRNYVP